MRSSCLLFIAETRATLYAGAKILWRKKYDNEYWNTKDIVAIPNINSQARVTVVLSNYFYDILLMPWSDAINTPDSMLSYAESFFTSVDAQPNPSTIRVTDQGYGNPFVATRIKTESIKNILDFGASLLPDCPIVSIKSLAVFLRELKPVKSGLFVCAENNKSISFYIEYGILLNMETAMADTLQETINLTSRQLLSLGKDKTPGVCCHDNQMGEILPPENWQIISIDNILTKIPYPTSSLLADNNTALDNRPLRPTYSASRFSMGVLLALFLAALLIIYHLNSAINEKRNEINSIQLKLADFRTEQEKNEKAQIKKKLNDLYFSLFELHHISWDILLSEMERLHNNDVALLGVEGDGRHKVLEITAEARNLAAANKYLADISASTIFRNTQIIRSMPPTRRCISLFAPNGIRFPSIKTVLKPPN